MVGKGGSRIIAIEEHYADPQLIDRFDGWRDVQPGRIVDRLLDLGDLRLKEMDEAGVDVQVLSHAPPAILMIEADVAVSLAHRMNDFLHEAINHHPKRFFGFAVLPIANRKLQPTGSSAASTSSSSKARWCTA